jgi:hypothetical protein
MLIKDSIAQIFKKKKDFSKRVAKVRFFSAEKKVSADKYLLIIGEARSKFGKNEF